MRRGEAHRWLWFHDEPTYESAASVDPFDLDLPLQRSAIWYVNVRVVDEKHDRIATQIMSVRLNVVVNLARDVLAVLSISNEFSLDDATCCHRAKVLNRVAARDPISWAFGRDVVNPSSEQQIDRILNSRL